MLEQQQQQNVFAGQSYSPMAEIHFNGASSWPCFFQVSHHALGHKENKDNMAGGGGLN